MIKTYVNGKLVDDMPAADRERFEAQGKARLADMLAAKRGPAIHTDATFFANMNAQPVDQDYPGVAEEYRRVAKAGGVNPVGKTYMPALAAFPGDPRAWISGKGDIERVCTERGWSCDGAVKVTNDKPEPRTAPAIAADIVEKMAAEVVAADPSVPIEAARETVVERHKPGWAKA